MKNKIFYILCVFFICNLFTSKSLSNDEIIFEVSEIEILEEGNLIKGLKKVKPSQMMVWKSLLMNLYILKKIF